MDNKVKLSILTIQKGFRTHHALSHHLTLTQVIQSPQIKNPQQCPDQDTHTSPSNG